MAGTGGLVARDEQPLFGAGCHSIPPSVYAAARRHGREPVARRGRQRPGVPGSGGAFVHDDVDDEPGVGALTDDVPQV